MTNDYSTHGNAFNGEVNWVQTDVAAAAADEDHLIPQRSA